MDLAAFLYVAENEGINVMELSQLLGTSPSNASRAAHRLAGFTTRAKRLNCPLIKLITNPNDERGRLLWLTPEGVESIVLYNDLIAGAAATERLRCTSSPFTDENR
jgi:DNA-binding MarR family transcriptional regulator